MKKSNRIMVLFLCVVFVCLSSCKKKEESLTASEILSENWGFILYPYDDSADKGDSTIKMYRRTVRNEQGMDETVWTFEGRVTTKFQYGYTGVSIVPTEETLEYLRVGARQIALKISGDGGQYRFIVETENVKDYNDFGKVLTFPQRAVTADIRLGTEDLRQQPDWGDRVNWEQSLIKGFKIQTTEQPLRSFRFSIHSIEVK